MSGRTWTWLASIAAARTVAFVDSGDRRACLAEVEHAFERAGWQISAADDDIGRADLVWAHGDPFSGDYPGLDPATVPVNHIDGLQLGKF